MSATTRTGVIAILVSATAFGLMPIFATYAYRAGVSVTTLLALRFAIASTVFLAWLALRGRLPRPTGRQWLALAALGAGLYATQSMLYFTAVERISPSLAVLLLYLYPAFVSILVAVVDRTRPSWRSTAGIALSLAGLALVVGRLDGELDLLGMLASVGSAVAYAVYVLVGKRASEQLTPEATTAYLTLFATGSFLVIGAGTGELALDFAASGWLWAVAVALISTVVAISAFFIGTTSLGPIRASVLCMVEPVIAVLAAVVLLGDHFTVLQALGGLVVLAGAAWGVTARRQTVRPQAIDPRHTAADARSPVRANR